MSDSEGCTTAFTGDSVNYKRVLWLIIVINAAMFAVETVASYFAESMALQADALDFLGDTVTYGLTLYVIGHAIRIRASASLLKGLILGGLGLWVLGTTLYRVFALSDPEPMIMGSIGAVAFAANIISAILLLKYRKGDSNVRSVWLSSRNDAIGNLAVMGAASGVWVTSTAWPDLIVAGVIAGLFLHSAIEIIRQARTELQRHTNTELIKEK